YSQVARREPDRVCLYIAGQFSPEVVQYNFDFFNGEQVEFLGPLTERKQVADVMRTCKYLLFPAFADASPNTVGEAIACGLCPLLINPIGGSQEVADLYGTRTYSIQEMANDYEQIFRAVLQG